MIDHVKIVVVIFYFFPSVVSVNSKSLFKEPIVEINQFSKLK